MIPFNEMQHHLTDGTSTDNQFRSGLRNTFDNFLHFFLSISTVPLSSLALASLPHPNTVALASCTSRRVVSAPLNTTIPLTTWLWEIFQPKIFTTLTLSGETDDLPATFIVPRQAPATRGARISSQPYCLAAKTGLMNLMSSVSAESCPQVCRPPFCSPEWPRWCADASSAVLPCWRAVHPRRTRWDWSRRRIPRLWSQTEHIYNRYKHFNTIALT